MLSQINPYMVDPNEPGGYTKKSLSIDQKRELYPDFIEASPRGLVPAIRHPDNKVVWESLPSSEYVEWFKSGARIALSAFKSNTTWR